MMPCDLVQASLQARASVVSNALAPIQLTLYAHPPDSLAKPFIIVLVPWL